MHTLIFSVRLMVTVLVVSVFFQSCKKTEVPSTTEGQEEISASKKKPPNPPPPPPPFYFTNCNNPTYSAALTVGVPANKTIIKNYVNSPGGSYPAFTSATVNGVTVSAPAGTFNVGSGSVVFTITGTPVSVGFNNVWISVGNIQPCMMFFTVVNAPASGPDAEPGPAYGSTGVINFTYKGQSVAYTTVRAKDNKVWLQQNLGSPQVAFHHADEASYGDYFQWGRWDDGHQDINAPVISGGPSLLNPSHIPTGNPNFISGSTVATSWWNSGGLSTDTWSGTSATSTNGKDPCTALGPGWRMPTQADWQNLKNHEDLEGAMAAFSSNLKLPTAGYKTGGYVFNNSESQYWTGSASSIHGTMIMMSDDTYSATFQASERFIGHTCRCVKD